MAAILFLAINSTTDERKPLLNNRNKKNNVIMANKKHMNEGDFTTTYTRNSVKMNEA